MSKKKTMMSLALLAGAATGAYYYFKKNPAKLESLKHKVLATAYEFEDEMM